MDTRAARQFSVRESYQHQPSQVDTGYVLTLRWLSPHGSAGLNEIKIGEIAMPVRISDVVRFIMDKKIK